MIVRSTPSATEQRLFAGPGEMRPAIGLDGGYSGTWTVRAGWCSSRLRRPYGNCADTVAVWCRGSRMYAVAAAGGPAADSPDARLGVRALVQLTDTARAPSARDLAVALEQVLTARAPNSAASFALGVFPLAADKPAETASLAVLGSDAGVWALTENGRPSTLLGPGTANRRTLDRLELVDGHIICLGSSGLVRGNGEQFAPLWRRFPDNTGFLHYLEDSAGSGTEDVAVVALWCGRYLVSHS